MGGLNEFIKNYLALLGSLLGLIGMGYVQVLNTEPSDHSTLAFVVFTGVAVSVVIVCADIIRQTKLVRRPQDVIRTPVNPPLARGLAAFALVVALVGYVVLTILFHIPSMRPILAQAGAESRDTNPWTKTLRGRPLDLGLNEAGRLFLPKKGIFFTSRPIYHITIDNRSTVSSPPLKLHLTLQIPPGRTSPPVIFAGAVATPAVYRWRPFGNLIGNWIFGRLPGAPRWLPYDDHCKDAPVGDAWCFFAPPADPRIWYDPELRLPSIPPRDSLEVYLELAFSEPGPPQAIPVTLDLRSAADGKFPVNVRRDVDLNAGLQGR